MAIGSAATAVPAHHRPFFRSLYFQELTAIALGVLLGHFYPQLGEQMKPAEPASQTRSTFAMIFSQLCRRGRQG